MGVVGGVREVVFFVVFVYLCCFKEVFVVVVGEDGFVGFGGEDDYIFDFFGELVYVFC